MALNIIITITRRSDSEQFADFYEKYGCTMGFSAVANGTARKSLLSRMGLEATEKVVLFTFAEGERARRLMRKLSSEMKIDMPDRGIAVAVPFSSAVSSTAAAFSPAEDKGNAAWKEEEVMESKYELIIAICASGCTDMVMDAARAAGAAGGTVIHAKGTGAMSAKKFFGLSIAAEKEMVFIVAKTSDKKAIMSAISRNAGADTEANALVFSLPVNDTAGFKLMEEE